MNAIAGPPSCRARSRIDSMSRTCPRCTPSKLPIDTIPLRHWAGKSEMFFSRCRNSGCEPAHQPILAIPGVGPASVVGEVAIGVVAEDLRVPGEERISRHAVGRAGLHGAQKLTAAFRVEYEMNDDVAEGLRHEFNLGWREDVPPLQGWQGSYWLEPGHPGRAYTLRAFGPVRTKTSLRRGAFA